MRGPGGWESEEMTLKAWRWVLFPRLHWRTYRLLSACGATMDYRTAWGLILLSARKHPGGRFPWVGDEQAAAAGVVTDDWNAISHSEKWWRVVWLAREGGKTPIQLLGVSEQDITAAGLRVIDWDVPTPLPTLTGPRPRRRRRPS